MRVAYCLAKSIECKFTIVVIPKSSLIFFKSSNTCFVVSGSNDATGSSANMIFASCANALAIDTRCCCPPDNSSARAYAFSKIFTLLTIEKQAPNLLSEIDLTLYATSNDTQHYQLIRSLILLIALQG